MTSFKENIIMKRTTLTILTMVMMILTVYGQDRTTKPKAVISTETISQLTTATGWMLNPEEEWVSLKNTIPVHLASEFNLLLDHEERGLGTDNFKYYKLKELTYNDSSYYVLIKQYRDGYYTYGSIKEGWNKLISHTAYIFAKSELNKLDRIKDGQLNMIEIEIIDNVNIAWTSEAEALKLIPTKIEWDKPIDKKRNLILHIAPYKEKNIVQFQIYTTYSKYNIIGGIIKEYEAKGGEYFFSTKKVYLTDELFKHCYYETDYATFNKFLTIEQK
jgi:hypothetical protein